jgi:hypothetical protein
MEELAGEQWLAIPGYPGYEASSSGRIRSLPRLNTRGGILRQQWIENRNCSRGYWKVYLWIGGKRFPRFVHRLVCLAFHGQPPDGHDDVAHQDHDSHNNVASNLKWSTHSANIAETYSEDAIMARARWEEECGLEPDYQQRRDLPF